MDLYIVFTKTVVRIQIFSSGDHELPCLQKNTDAGLFFVPRVHTHYAVHSPYQSPDQKLLISLASNVYLASFEAVLMVLVYFLYVPEAAQSASIMRSSSPRWMFRLTKRTYHIIWCRVITAPDIGFAFFDQELFVKNGMSFVIYTLLGMTANQILYFGLKANSIWYQLQCLQSPRL